MPLFRKKIAQMAQLKRVAQRTADFFVLPVYWKICRKSIDKTIKYLCHNDEHPTNCAAFVAHLGEGVKTGSSLANEVRMLDDGRCLVFTSDTLDEGTKNAIEFISYRHKDYDCDLVFPYYGGLSQFAKLLTDHNGFRPLDCDFEVVELPDGREVYFLRAEKTETFNGH